MAFGELLPPVVAKLMGDISDFQSKMGAAQVEMAKTEATGSAAFTKLASVGKTALIGLGAAAVGAGVFGVKMADDFEKAHANLVTAITNSGHKMSEFTGAIDKQHQAFENLGYSNTQYEAALGALTTATNNPTQALSYMSVVADFAAKSHHGLEESAIAVGKALAGNLRPLKQLGLDLPFAATNAVKLQAAQTALAKAQEHLNEVLAKHGPASLEAKHATEALTAAQDKLNKAQSNGENIVNALGQRLQGSAARQAETFGGQLKILEAQLQDVGIQIGQWLIPKLQDLAGILLDGVHWLEAHETAATALAIVIGGALVAAVTAFIGLKIVNTIQNTIKFFQGLVALGGQIVAFFLGNAAAETVETVALTANSAAHEGNSLSMAGMIAKFQAGGYAAEGLGAGATEAGLGIGVVAGAAVLATGALAAGIIAMSAFGNASEQAVISTDKLGKQSLTQLTKSIRDNIVAIQDNAAYQATSTNSYHQTYQELVKAANATDAYGRSVAQKQLAEAQSIATTHINSQAQKDFQEVLKKSPASAEPVIAALQRLGINTDQLTYKMMTNAHWIDYHRQKLLEDANAALALEASQHHVTEALGAYTDAQNAAAQAGDDGGVAQQRVADTADAAKRAILDEIGVLEAQISKGQLSAQSGHDQAAALERLKGVFPALDDAIQSEIDKLNSIPLTKDTKVTVDIQNAYNSVNDYINKLASIPGATDSVLSGYYNTQLRAEGGPVSGGQAYIVGERGPELFVPNSSGTIVPNGAGGDSASGNSYQIVINAGTGSDPAEIGRVTVDAIKAYERRNGSTWRN